MRDQSCVEEAAVYLGGGFGVKSCKFSGFGHGTVEYRRKIGVLRSRKWWRRNEQYPGRLSIMRIGMAANDAN
jgi:hypothetical protein